MSKDADISLIHKKSRKLYEKLSVLKFIEKNMEMTTESPIKTTKEVAPKVSTEKATSQKQEVQEEKTIVKENTETASKVTSVEETKETITEQVPEKLEKEPAPNTIKTSHAIADAIKAANDIKKATELKYSLENEFKDAVSANMAQEIFEGADTRVIESALSAPKASPIRKTMNSSGIHNGLQIGLNDRIAFVKYLFNGNLTDFNRVLSQLNTFNNEKEASNFISKMVKPDYNWVEHEDIENRLLEIIERKFS
ncbi:MAG: hypothetical protein COB98_11410 [Flavobacteriaceae bacterium]|nr:MAG: hypothetical protein COB98_11410 [Flavobacteriaceae bacterium]